LTTESYEGFAGAKLRRWAQKKKDFPALVSSRQVIDNDLFIAFFAGLLIMDLPPQ
jgi:hypothetical protein